MAKEVKFVIDEVKSWENLCQDAFKLFGGKTISEFCVEIGATMVKQFLITESDHAQLPALEKAALAPKDPASIALQEQMKTMWGSARKLVSQAIEQGQLKMKSEGGNISKKLRVAFVQSAKAVKDSPQFQKHLSDPSRVRTEMAMMRSQLQNRIDELQRKVDQLQQNNLVLLADKAKLQQEVTDIKAKGAQLDAAKSSAGMSITKDEPIFEADVESLSGEKQQCNFIAAVITSPNWTDKDEQLQGKARKDRLHELVPAIKDALKVSITQDLSDGDVREKWHGLSKEEVCKRIDQPTFWGGYEELMVFGAFSSKTDYMILDPRNRKCEPYPVRERKEVGSVAYLYFKSNSHYDSFYVKTEKGPIMRVFVKGSVEDKAARDAILKRFRPDWEAQQAKEAKKQADLAAKLAGEEAKKKAEAANQRSVPPSKKGVEPEAKTSEKPKTTTPKTRQAALSKKPRKPRRAIALWITRVQPGQSEGDVLSALKQVNIPVTEVRKASQSPKAMVAFVASRRVIQAAVAGVEASKQDLPFRACQFVPPRQWQGWLTRQKKGNLQDRMTAHRNAPDPQLKQRVVMAQMQSPPQEHQPTVQPLHQSQFGPDQSQHFHMPVQAHWRHGQTPFLVPWPVQPIPQQPQPFRAGFPCPHVLQHGWCPLGPACRFV